MQKEIKNKRILIVCEETFSYPFYFLAEEWAKNNVIAFLWINYQETGYKESQINDTTYYAFLKKYKNQKHYTFDEAARTFTENINSLPIDFDYIREIERKYGKTRNLNQQLMSSQGTSRYYHYRNYHKLMSYKVQMYWLELVYKEAEFVLDNFKPDVIFDLDTVEIQRAALYEAARYRHIPYINCEYTRYESYQIPTFCFGLDIEEYFYEAYKKNLSLSQDALREEYEYIDNFRKADTILAKQYKGNDTSKYKAKNRIDIAKRIYSITRYLLEQDYKGKAKELKKKNPYIFHSSSEFVKFIIRYELINRKYLKKNKLFDVPRKGEKYLYIPLHLIPESSTFVKAPFWVNELSIIEALSKSVPADWMIYVKEHQAMLGEREVSFYKRVKKLHNVRLIQTNYYTDPKPLIANCIGVVTVTGTSAYEAALYGKKSLVFGSVPFELIDGITRVRAIEDLPNLLREFGEIDNKHSSAVYIHTVKELGTKFNLIYIRNESLAAIRNNIHSEKILEEVNKVKAFIEKGYSICFCKE